MKKNENEDIRGKVLDSVTLVGYGKGAVVSRTIMEKKTGTVTIFAFDKGQGLSEHTAPFDAMAAIIEGEAVITVAGKANKVKGGEFMIMPANKPHSLKAVTKFKMVLVMIRS